MSRAASKRAGERVESVVIQRLDALGPVVVRDAHIDARAAGAIWPSEVPTVGLAVVEAGTAVEIKSCSVVVTDAQDRGRFLFRRVQHDHLRECGGVYLCVVTPPHGGDPLAWKIVPAGAIGAALPSWHDLDGRETYARLTWSRVFDPAEVESDPHPHAGSGEA